MHMLSPDTKSTFTIKVNAPGAVSPGGMLAGRRGVPLSLPLSFLLTGAVGASIFGALLPWVLPEAMISPFFPHALALVHIATLGWLTMTIIGATLQLLPVIIVGPLRGARFIRWLYPSYLLGVVCLLSGFWWMLPWLMALGGTLIVLSITHYITVLGITIRHATTRPLTLRFLIAALVYLGIVVSLGLTAALNFVFGFLGAGFDRLLLTHITLGVVGWLSSMLIGVSYTLVRMFALAHRHDDKLGRIVFVLLNGGIVVLATGVLTSWGALDWIGGASLLAAAWLFAWDYWRMLRVRQRKVLDVTQYHSSAAVIYLALALPLATGALLFGWQKPGVFAALALLIFVGWLGQSIAGYLYKIVPFLIWHEHYGPQVGHKKVPLMRDMISQPLALLSFWLINLGLLATALLLVTGWTLPAQVASGFLGMGLLLAAANSGRVLLHLRRS